MLNVVMLKVVMLNVVMLSVIMLNVVMLNAVMLNVVMLNVIMLNVVTLSVMAPFLRCIRFFVRTMIKQTRGPYFKTFYSRNLWYAKPFTAVSQVHPGCFTHSFGP